jgi:lipoprotein NlpI
LNQGASQEEAATKAFGDLHKLQENLVSYIGRFTFLAFDFPAPSKIPESSLHTRPLSETEVDAYSGGFLALHGQFQPAESLLKQSAQLDPKLALAQRNLGFLHYFRNERPEAIASFSSAIDLDSQDANTHFLRAQLTFDDGSRTNPQIEADLRQVLALKPDFADANGLLAVYLAANNEKLPEALGFAQKAVHLQPGNLYFQLALAQVLVRARRYDDAEALGRRVLARTSDDNIRSETDKILTYVTQARDYDARVRQQQEESAARAAALASASRAEQVEAKSEQVAVRSDEVAAERISDPSGPPADPNAPVLKRRVAPNEVIGVVIQVHCEGDEMEVTTKVDARPAPLVFHAKDRTRIGYTSSLSAIHKDIEPCSELKGHTAKLAFSPSQSKWLDGELTHIELEK